MDVSNAGAANGYQYQPKTANDLKEEVRNGADGMAVFYGASVTKEQSDKLQSVIRDLEQQPNGNLGDAWNVGAYNALPLRSARR